MELLLRDFPDDLGKKIKKFAIDEEIKVAEAAAMVTRRGFEAIKNNDKVATAKEEVVRHLGEEYGLISTSTASHTEDDENCEVICYAMKGKTLSIEIWPHEIVALLNDDVNKKILISMNIHNLDFKEVVEELKK